MRLWAFISRRALNNIRELCSYMGLPSEVCVRAEKLYMHALKESKKIFGRRHRLSHHSLLLVSVAAVARDMGIPFNINKAIKVLRERGGRVSRSDVMRTQSMLKKAGIILDGRDLIEYYASIVARLSGVEKGYLMLRARNILRLARDVQGRNPHILSLAAVYLALRKERNISIKLLSDITGYSQSSIRDCVRILSKAGRVNL